MVVVLVVRKVMVVTRCGGCDVDSDGDDHEVCGAIAGDQVNVW